MNGLTLEERVESLERLFAKSKTNFIKNCLSQLAEIIFKDKKLNPNGLSADKHSTFGREVGYIALIIDGIGKWVPFELDDITGITLDDDSYDRLEDIVKSFNNDNNCRIEMSSPPESDEIHFVITRLPNEPRNRGDRFSRPDDQWEDPDFQDARAAARWDQHKRDFPGNY